MIRAIQTAESDFTNLKLPLLIMHGGKDKLTNPEGSKDLYLLSKSTDKELKIYDEMYHEILNEPERQAVITHIKDWILSRL